MAPLADALVADGAPVARARGGCAHAGASPARFRPVCRWFCDRSWPPLVPGALAVGAR
jgi:hypothetical protein